MQDHINCALADISLKIIDYSHFCIEKIVFEKYFRDTCSSVQSSKNEWAMMHTGQLFGCPPHIPFKELHMRMKIQMIVTTLSFGWTNK